MTYLLTCKECNQEFFTPDENDYFIRRGLSLPKLCKECRDRHKALLDEISKRWKLDAMQESSAYFYNIQEAAEILNGEKCFVIGRKGSGKTAIVGYVDNLADSNIFTRKMSFKNFPFNILYQLSNEKYTIPNQYITIWKFIIYSTVCRLIIKNEAIDANFRLKLVKIYGNDPNKSLEQLIEHWTTKEFSLQILGTGFGINGEKAGTKEVSWFDKTDLLEELLLKYLDESKYYILFDELDEDYRAFATQEEKTQYIYLLTGLLKAVQNIRGVFRSQNNLYPVVFLRNDIFSMIRDPDKNKWSDFIIELEWNQEKIKNMLTHRLGVALSEEKKNFNELWYYLFQNAQVSMGHEASRKMDAFSYIARSTQMRPRDFIKYLQECATIAKSRNTNYIYSDIIKEADDAFSEYLKGEIIDEIHVEMPEINEVLAIFSQIRKQTFNPSEFTVAYNEFVHKGKIIDRGAENTLILLFDVNVIGNQPTMKGKTIFKYENKSARFNYKENIMIHRGLFKALQIF